MSLRLVSPSVVDGFRLRASSTGKSQKLQRSRILSRPFVLDEKRPSVVFSGACVGGRGCLRGHVGAGVSRRLRGCHRVCMGLRVSGCAGERVRWCLLFCYCSCLFVPLSSVTAKHDRTHSQTLSPSQTFVFFSEFLRTLRAPCRS